ncbi:TPA: J domain-containing protein [Aeromonas hydrophila]|uniref:J domain-containing protein n=1 Tax=Aeromonas caviae TaxID=648 RepID=UPI001A1EB52E|nr:J domain-containing protein [Aeromonas caviae]HAT2492089.1 J domain-containing protein [Aeromonas hydrophila]MDN6868915.1 J domain-containing protein [Aeromonas caviae]HAT2497343.1 J domain-containing protein [Aeromonas hydrophila]HAT2512183.1 J domain-containing protein [Aeromonas hydrophila]HAT2532674.1 J domain-containing protein [Aeromonas hydrophila]
MKWTDIDTKTSYKNQLEILRAQNPYERLGISIGATMDDVKKAYRKKMKLYHPDRTDNFMASHGEEISKLLNLAVEQIKSEIGK